MTLIWEYNSDLFEAATITRMVGHYLRLLEEIIADPFKCVSEYSVVTEQETQELLQSFNRTRYDYPDNKCIQELFETQTEKVPDAIAVVFAEQHKVCVATQLAQKVGARVFVTDSDFFR